MFELNFFFGVRFVALARQITVRRRSLICLAFFGYFFGQCKKVTEKPILMLLKCSGYGQNTLIA